MSGLELSFREIQAATGGKPLSSGGDSESAPLYSEMVFDSRNVSPDCVFLCIRGARVDAHDFVPQAVGAGARVVIGDDPAKLSAHARAFAHVRFLAVSDSLMALTRLATFYRRKFAMPVIGLTGSSGKTTTKDLLASILEAAGPAMATEGSLNNHWGVPQSVMRLRRAHRAAVFELGTSGFGEIAGLCAICQPDMGYITNVGASHLQMLGSEDGVLKAKRELYDWIAGSEHPRALLFNLDDPRLEKLHAQFAARGGAGPRVITISQASPKADLRIAAREPLGLEHRFGWRYELESPWGRIEGVLPLPGPHNLFNAASAAAVALASGAAKPEDVAKGLEKPRISKLRSDLFRAPSGAVVYDDSYNANPASVAALFEAARLIRANEHSGLSRAIAAVGDMRELGPKSCDFHREAGALAARGGVDVLLATGAFAKDWVAGFLSGSSAKGHALAFASQEELIASLEAKIAAAPTQTLVLVKGSRGARMDQVTARLRGTPT